MDNKTETQETQPVEKAKKLSPEQKARIQNRIQGLGAGISQAEEAKADALSQVGAAMKEGNLDQADHMLKVAGKADQDSSTMQIEQMDLQVTLEAEKAEKPSAPDQTPKQQDQYITTHPHNKGPEFLESKETEPRSNPKSQADTSAETNKDKDVAPPPDEDKENPASEDPKEGSLNPPKEWHPGGVEGGG